MLCLPCLGTGRYPGTRTCPTCSGRGELPDDRVHNAMCPFCIGTGRDSFRKGSVCSACEGWGRVASRKDPVAAGGAEPPRPKSASNGSGNPDRSVDQCEASPSDRLDDLLRNLVGDVDVCEPSLDAEGLRRLRSLSRCDLIRVLAHDVDGDVARRVREFTRELPRFLFRRYRGRQIYDRYVLTPGEIVFLGPGAEDGDTGTPELIRVPFSVARDMIEDVRLDFDRRWAAGDRLG